MQPLPKAKLTEFVALGRKVGRQTAGLYLAEGQKVCAEALAAGQRPVALLLTEALADTHPEWAALAEATYRVTDAQLARISTHAAPDGALAVLPCPVQPTPLPVVGPAFLLYEVADPGNLGTLLRTAAWYGFRALYASAGTVEATNPKVVRAAMGAFFRVPVYTVADFEGWVAAHAQRIVATYVTGEPPAPLPPERDWLLLGSESHGLPPAWPSQFGILPYTVPHGPGGSGESLNVALTGAILADRLRGLR
ncbi:MAG: RNA methyltransferase [Bacteroidia bacterium]|nr:RNA methyltransferase [Bacteroidia bacterium]